MTTRLDPSLGGTPAPPHRPVMHTPDPGMRPQCSICGNPRDHWRHVVPSPRPIPREERATK